VIGGTNTLDWAIKEDILKVVFEEPIIRRYGRSVFHAKINGRIIAS
jgi:hypothetical protein